MKQKKLHLKEPSELSKKQKRALIKKMKSGLESLEKESGCGLVIHKCIKCGGSISFGKCVECGKPEKVISFMKSGI